MVKIAESLKKFCNPELLAQLEQAVTLAEQEKTERVKAREEAQENFLLVKDAVSNAIEGVKASLGVESIPNFSYKDGETKLAGVKGTGNGTGLGIPKSPTSPLTLEKDGVAITIGKGQTVSLNRWYKENGGKTPQDNGGTGKTVSRKSVEAFAKKNGWTIKE